MFYSIIKKNFFSNIILNAFHLKQKRKINKFLNVSFQKNNKEIIRPRRVLFNVPGSDERKITKSTQLNLDCVVLDLEDGVAINQKENARIIIKKSLKNLSFGRAEKLIRINSIGSGFEKEDLENCIKEVASLGYLDGLVIPKVESFEHLQYIGNFLDKCGEQAKNVKLLAAIESAKAIVDLKDICQKANNRLEALIDLCANVGMTRTPEAKELLFARSTIVFHAVAFQLQSIDMVCLDYKNTDILLKEALEGRQMGYTGKQAIHPNQIESIYQAFYPTQKELELAKKIIEENEKYQNEGKGAFSIDGKMIDMPMVKWAKNILSRTQIFQNKS